MTETRFWVEFARRAIESETKDLIHLSSNIANDYEILGILNSIGWKASFLQVLAPSNCLRKRILTRFSYLKMQLEAKNMSMSNARLTKCTVRSGVTHAQTTTDARWVLEYDKGINVVFWYLHTFTWSIIDSHVMIY